MLDWKIGDEHIVIGKLSEPEQPPPTPRPWRRWLLRAAGVLAVVALVVFAYNWRIYLARHERLHVDAQAAVDSEMATLLSGAQGVVTWDEAADRLWQTRYIGFARTWARAAGGQATARVLDVELIAPDLALAQVETRIGGPGSERVLQSVRAYRIVGTQWQRTSIDERAWGSWEVTETTHFRLVYRHRDAELAEAVAEGLDPFAERLAWHYGPFLPQQQRTSVIIDISAPWTDIVRTEEGYRVGSPLASFNGVDSQDTPAGLVRWNLASALVSQAANDAAAVGQNATSLGTLVQPANPNVWRGLRGAMLQAEARLLATPPAGTRQATSAALRAALAEGRLLPPSRLETAASDMVLTAAEWDAFGEFLVARYGPDAPSRMIIASASATTWDDLIRAALRISSSELDAAFRNWLQDRK